MNPKERDNSDHKYGKNTLPNEYCKIIVNVSLKKTGTKVLHIINKEYMCVQWIVNPSRSLFRK